MGHLGRKMVNPLGEKKRVEMRVKTVILEDAVIVGATPSPFDYLKINKVLDILAQIFPEKQVFATSIEGIKNKEFLEKAKNIDFVKI